MDTIDWSNLSFGYMKTDYNVRSYYRDGKWGEPQLETSEYKPAYGSHVSALRTGSI